MPNRSIFEGLIIGGPLAGETAAKTSAQFDIMAPTGQEVPADILIRYVFTPLFIDPAGREEIWVWTPEGYGKAEIMQELMDVYEKKAPLLREIMQGYADNVKKA